MARNGNLIKICIKTKLCNDIRQSRNVKLIVLLLFGRCFFDFCVNFQHGVGTNNRSGNRQCCEEIGCICKNSTNQPPYKQHKKTGFQTHNAIISIIAIVRKNSNIYNRPNKHQSCSDYRQNFWQFFENSVKLVVIGVFHKFLEKATIFARVLLFVIQIVHKTSKRCANRDSMQSTQARHTQAEVHHVKTVLLQHRKTAAKIFAGKSGKNTPHYIYSFSRKPSTLCV